MVRGVRFAIAAHIQGRLAFLTRMVSSIRMVFVFLAVGQQCAIGEGVAQELPSMNPQTNPRLPASGGKMEISTSENRSILGIVKQAIADAGKARRVISHDDITARLSSFFPLGINIDHVRAILADEKLRSIVTYRGGESENHFVSWTKVIGGFSNISVALHFYFTERDSELKLDRFIAFIEAASL